MAKVGGDMFEFSTQFLNFGPRATEFGGQSSPDQLQEWYMLISDEEILIIYLTMYLGAMWLCHLLIF